MATEVILPKVDMDMAAGKIAHWFHKDGDTVIKGEPLFEIETDKAAMEVEAPATGVLRGVSAAENVDIPVGQVVAWIYADGEEGVAALSAAAAAAEQEDRARTVDPLSHPGMDGARTVGTVARAPAEQPGWPGESPHGAKTRATPAARRMARQNGMDLSALQGSGPNGRVQRADVETAAGVAAEIAGAARSSDQGPAGVRPVAPIATALPASDIAGPLHSVWLRRGTGTPVVLIHGFGADLASWRPLLAALDRPMSILGIDLPGHGGSVAVEAAGFDSLVASVEATLAARGIGEARLVGHSLGGAVAAAVAAGSQIEARSLFLLAPAGLGTEINSAFIDGFAAAVDEAAIRTSLHELVADPAVLSDSFVNAVIRARADGRLAAAQVPLGKALFADNTQSVAIRSLFDHLRMPVKIAVGAADRVIPSQQATGLPGMVALHVFPGVGHLPYLERSLETGRLLAQLVHD